MSRKVNENVTKALVEVSALAEKFGVPTLRTAVRKWDKEITLKAKLMARKAGLEKELAELQRKVE